MYVVRDSTGPYEAVPHIAIIESCWFSLSQGLHPALN